MGYGIDPSFRNKGYTTETVRALMAWAFANENYLSVVADTQKSNVASGRVLEKAGMHVYGETEEALLWRIESKITHPGTF
jgi:RimJ/RimL family protein N-acetyltransferase